MSSFIQTRSSGMDAGDAGHQVSSVPCAQTLIGNGFSGHPAMTIGRHPIGQIIQVEQPMSFMQAPSVVCKDEKCACLAESPIEKKLPSRCTMSNLNGLPNDRPSHSSEQNCDALYASGDGLYTTTAGSFMSYNRRGSVQLIPCQQTYQTISLSNRGNHCPGTPMMQYATHSSDGILPDDKIRVQASTGDMSAYQIRSPTSGLSQEIVSSPDSVPSPQQLSEEASRKRELRLMKNREAARECRRKKKEYVKCLENRVAVLEKQNKTLIEELKALKDLYSHKTE
nr:cAMP responsive element modulator b isoform X2 [Misgurnus anguillicaudatus]